MRSPMGDIDMGILDRFRTKKTGGSDLEMTFPSVSLLKAALVSVGCTVTDKDIAVAHNRFSKLSVELSMEPLEELRVSNIAELGCTSQNSYHIYQLLADLPSVNKARGEIIAVSKDAFLSINELCRVKGLSQLVLKPGERVPLLGDDIDRSHPLSALVIDSMREAVLGMYVDKD